MPQGGAFLKSRKFMIHAYKLRQVSLAASCALALGAMSGSAGAQSNAPPPGHLTSPNGLVVMSGSGLCVRADTGATSVTGPFCDPNAALAPTSELPVPAPQPVAAAEAPALPATPPMAIAAVTLDADALFDFDKSALRPAGQLALDDFAGKVKGMNAETITIFGYTDRLGTDVYNQQLSERRVDTVRTYLEGKGIASNGMRGEGRGNSQPVTKPGECDGGENAAVIACLQPDRRVEIEVTGTPVVM